MQRNLRWKLLLIAAIVVVSLYYFISPREKGAPLFSRINLGLDLKGGIHLVLQVVTEDALNQELVQDAERVVDSVTRWPVWPRCLLYSLVMRNPTRPILLL